MTAKKRTGHELVADILARGYDPDFLAAYFATFAGKVADDQQGKAAPVAAREVLEALADEAFLAANPFMKRRDR